MQGIVQLIFLCEETLCIRQVVGALMYSTVHVHVASWLLCIHQKQAYQCQKIFSPSESIFAAWQTLVHVYWVSVRPQDKIP